MGSHLNFSDLEFFNHYIIILNKSLSGKLIDIISLLRLPHLVKVTNAR